MMQVTTDGTQPDSQQTPRPSPATARSRSSTLAGPCLEPWVSIRLSVPLFCSTDQHCIGLTCCEHFPQSCSAGSSHASIWCIFVADLPLSACVYSTHKHCNGHTLSQCSITLNFAQLV